MYAPLDVDAAVALRGPAGSAALSGRGDRLRLDAAEPRTLVALARLGRRPLAGVRLAGRAASALGRAGLALEVAVAGRTVGRLGFGARPGRLPALFGLGGVELRLGQLIRVLVLRRGGRA